MDTNETFIVTRLNNKPLNTITTFVESVQSTLRPHTSTKTATPLVNCIVNDGLIVAVSYTHLTLPTKRIV